MRKVTGSGPPNARLAIIGEAPGPIETARGAPFLGRTGSNVRRMLRTYGWEPDAVYFDNVIPFNYGRIESVQQMQSLVRQHSDHLAETLSNIRPEVIIACGRAASYGLLGLSNIGNFCGGMHATGLESVSILPSSVKYVIPCIHPAAVMRTKVGAGWLLIEAAFSRAVRVLKNQLDPRTMWTFNREWASADEIDAALTGATKVSIDTEFDPTTYSPFLIGLSADGYNVLSASFSRDVILVLKKHMARRDLMKIAHYHVADTSALLAAGVDPAPPFFDTLEAYSHCFPDLPVGLAHAARHLFDGYTNWKGMAHDDPDYNAIDVVTAWRLEEELAVLMGEAGIADSFWLERMPATPLLHGMEIRGLQTDDAVRKQRVADSLIREAELEKLLKEFGDEFFAKRIAAAQAEASRASDEITALVATPGKGEQCGLHPNYTGVRGKRFTSSEDCTCRAIHGRAASVRASIASSRKAAGPTKNRVKRWLEGGFNPTNPDHLKWLLYEGLGLPKQRKDGKLTANADAFAKLTNKEEVRNRPEILSFLADNKELRHLRKRRATFLFGSAASQDRLDHRNVAHPPYRAFGTGTGRPAGGSDAATSDRVGNAYSFNALNIPKDCRSIYIPHNHLDVSLAYAVTKKEEEEDVLWEDEENSGVGNDVGDATNGGNN